jgi:hypothetical protein
MPVCPEPAVVCENNWASIDTADSGIDFTPEEGYDPLVDPLYYRRRISGDSIDNEFGSVSFTMTEEIDLAFDRTSCSGSDLIFAELTVTEEGGGTLDYTTTFEVDCGAGTEIRTATNIEVYELQPDGFHTITRTITSWIGDDYCDPAAEVTEVTEDLWTGFGFGNEYETYELPVTWADMQAEIPSLIDSASVGVAEECWYSSTCAASLELNTTGTLLSIQATALRFRFRIPITHTGSKFFFTYDIAEFPTAGDPSFVSQDNVAEWTGPGTGIESDPSWLTEWVVIPPPEVAGERRVVNVRYTCYSGAKYGAKPQLVGEAFP